MVRYEGWRKNNTNTEVTIAFYRQCCIMDIKQESNKL
jgi:hypothetical protein